MKKNKLHRLFLATCLITIPACAANPRLHIEGIVMTQPGLASSYLSPNPFRDARFDPVAGATICLAFDADAADLIDKTMTLADLDGSYKIDAYGIPPPKTSRGVYYIVAKHEGYIDMICEIKIGTFSPYLNNRIVLKKHEN